MKRPRADVDSEGRPTKLIRALSVDRISRLSDELLLRILGFVPVANLTACLRVSHKFYQISSDSQIWKAAYYNRFVRPRASRIPRIKDAGVSNHLSYSSRLSKWLGEGDLVRNGQETDWKKRYKLRHKWSKGQCAVREIPVSERASVPPLLARMHDGIIFTTDSISGLRAWNAKGEREVIASVTLDTPGNGTTRSPTSLATDLSGRDTGNQKVVVGFNNGSFTIFDFRKQDKDFLSLFNHAPSSNGMLSALAYSSPYLLTMTDGQLLSLYTFSDSFLTPPRLLYSLRSYTVWPPVSLAVRTTATSVTASTAYALPTYPSGWTVGIQETRLSPTGELIESRLATAADEHFHSLARDPSMLSPPTRPSSPFPGHTQESVVSDNPACTKPTSLSYSHPYLLASHPDNTLTLYLVTSTSSSLSISAGSRLWGHTSSVSGAHIGGHGKAVSVSRVGDELRVWDLEGGMASSAVRRRFMTGNLSVRIQPEKAAKDLSDLSDAISQRGSGLGLALEERFDDPSVTRGWVGFDEENVIVLREKSHGRQSLVVYDFT
ncbi:F-box domain-containing protein [Lindgomyces ingoldianus]|uniref:F-box domain-containing protein n=1 Tax=Lindgomyces ingoldianus TaxID=673940 RepID=A0ACB6QYX3_9PLEO|nr:F-box domain-containing protein [Lindgomyces ingoldianus]KAF2471292.1 F-box domain-containing protein [Lindgomyces ingoldianus]